MIKKFQRTFFIEKEGGNTHPPFRPFDFSSGFRQIRFYTRIEDFRASERLWMYIPPGMPCSIPLAYDFSSIPCLVCCLFKFAIKTIVFIA